MARTHPRSDAGGRSRRRRPRDRAAVAASVLTVSVLAFVVAPTMLDGIAAYRRTRQPVPTGAPVVAQADPEGCGAALLSTLLARAGRPVPQAILLAEAPPGPTGITLAAFRRLADGHGLVGVWQVRRGASPPSGSFVAHLSRPDGHFVFVEGRAGDYLHVLDPASGAAMWHLSTFRARWSGRYLRLEATG